MAVLPPDPVFNLRHIEMGAVNCICFHNSDRLFCGTAKGAVYLWDLQVNWEWLIRKSRLCMTWAVTKIYIDKIQKKRKMLLFSVLVTAHFVL